MSKPIKILITGDLCPHNRVEKLVMEGNYEAIFNDFVDVFAGNDLNVTDLECPLTELKVGRKKTGPHQKAHPKCIEILKQANIGLATMSNNHMLDFGATGANQTIECCKSAGIATVGIGKGKTETRLPFILNVNNKKIAFLNFADNEFLTAPDGSVQANPIDPIHNHYDIQNAKVHNDFVIVIVHGGNEFYHLPSPRTKELYRYYTDIGADAVISHHTHTFSGYEVYQGKPIFYGLGNFIYDWPGKVNADWNRGYVVKLSVTDKIDFEIIPLKQCNLLPGVFHLNEQEEKAFREELKFLSTIIADDDKLEYEFRNYCNTVYPMYNAFIEPYFGKVITALRRRGLFPNLMRKQKRLLLLNITRCESHKDILHRMLKNYE